MDKLGTCHYMGQTLVNPNDDTNILFLSAVVG